MADALWTLARENGWRREAEAAERYLLSRTARVAAPTNKAALDFTLAWHGEPLGRLRRDGYEWRWKPAKSQAPALVRETAPTHNHGHAAAVHAAHAAAQAQAAQPAPQAHADPSSTQSVHGPAVVLGVALAAAATQGAGQSTHPAAAAAAATQGRTSTAGVFA